MSDHLCVHGIWSQFCRYCTAAKKYEAREAARPVVDGVRAAFDKIDVSKTAAIQRAAEEIADLFGTSPHGPDAVAEIIKRHLEGQTP